MKPIPEICQKLILEDLKEPVVFKKFIDDWPMRSWGLEEWSRLFESRPLNFRIGKKEKRRRRVKPQLETESRNTNLTFQEFTNWSKSGSMQLQGDSSTTHWAYCDYKYMKDMFAGNTQVLKMVDWSSFGFEGRDGEYSTLWMGSAGANTPGHYDTYGCNLHAQLYGRKQWVLFPPTDCMCPTRVPYEESSIWSGRHVSSCPDSTSPRLVELFPGDVLYVPRHWWHFVTNLDLAISVNSWIDMESLDNRTRIEEALVRTLMGALFRDLPRSLESVGINPTEDDFLDTPSTVNLWYVQESFHQWQQSLGRKSKVSSKKLEWKDYPEHIISIPVLQNEELQSRLQETFERFPQVLCIEPLSSSMLPPSPTASDQSEPDVSLEDQHGIEPYVLRSVIEAFTDPSIIEQVTNLVIKKISAHTSAEDISES